ncbi:hypothetical protein KAR91_69115 [Candidatus Pacearchaeota archaeon]|nr:hypothetical protein [Candidatus Pacearchaeota archaeon]
MERAYHTDHHFHSKEYWFGISANQAGNDWGAERLVAYQAISGNNAYGSDPNDEAKVLGTDDTPIQTGGQEFDLHRLLVVGVSVNTEYRLRIVWGTGTMADAIAANQMSVLMVKFDSVNPQLSAGIPVEVRMPEIPTDNKVWIQAWNVTNNATIDFYVGVHEYYMVES